MASSIVATLSSTLHELAAVPWLEEVVTISFIGVAFILTHKFGFASVRPVKGHKLSHADDDSSCCDDPVKPRLARRVREPERRTEGGVSRAPTTSMEVPGVTDRRFAGRIVSYKEDEGYGFISCPELYPRFRRDVFLHKLQIGSFSVGSAVSFGIFLNKNGQPQAKDLETQAPLPMPDPSVWQGWNVGAAPFEMPAQRQPLNPHAKPFQTQIGEAADRAATPPLYVPETAEAEAAAKGSGEKRWAPKAPHGKPQWVPKKAAA